MSKLVILVLSCAIACLSVAAEQPSIVQHINAGGNIVIYQPESLGKLVSTPEAVASDVEREESDGYVNASGSSHVSTRVGYRVQVFDDNNPRTARRQAEARHSQVKSQFPQMRTYLTFNSPYWRVKVGDFRTRAEAEAAMAELRHAFPSMAAYMRIVREKINTLD